jgi:hypothetical protein
MMTDKNLGVLSDAIAALDKKLDTKFEHVDKKLLDHDDLFEAIGNTHIELARKLDIVIEQTKEIPRMRDDIMYLKIEAAHTRNDIGKINDRLIVMESKDDYLLQRINDLDVQLQKISARQYA